MCVSPVCIIEKSNSKLKIGSLIQDNWSWRQPQRSFCSLVLWKNSQNCTRRETVNLLLLLNTAEMFVSSGTEAAFLIPRKHSPPRPPPLIIMDTYTGESRRKIIPCVVQFILSLQEAIILFIDHFC